MTAPFDPGTLLIDGSPRRAVAKQASDFLSGASSLQRPGTDGLP